ncbi:hypothetical protein Tsubulata_022216 [Turnera subulata]|uniref:BSD2 cysteine rich domain-containing protein n=1 Tax=Turnera subulata TaxID=218843 RepID=A0A9Q0FSH4_9ROSI|nr:hypothetical protein Tsubulata_022216 [Turnera subulata]
MHEYRDRSKNCSLVPSLDENFVELTGYLRLMDWLIKCSLCLQQPRPVACSSCDSNGHVECKWCRGTGFFIIGDNMLCQVPSRNTTCVICAGKGSMCCSDCKGTGFRAKWMEEPPVSK